MRGLTAQEYEVLCRTDSPSYFEVDASNVEAAQALYARGMLGRREPNIIFVTSLGRTAMWLHRATHGMA